MEKAILNVDNLYISQGMNGTFSHKGDLAIDITNCSYLKAPFTGIIKRIYENCNAVWLESKEKVEYADGTIDYMTIMTLHDNDISNLKVGKEIKQGEIYYHPGIKGNATGSHIHMSICRGKFTGNGWYKNTYGNWCSNNQYDIAKSLFLHIDVKVINGWYNWKKINELTKNKNIDEIASEVIQGLWGNNPQRKQKLIKAGYDYNLIQKRVNELLNVPTQIIYIVKRGDCLSKIGKKYNKNWKAIAKDNNIKFPWIIYPEQKLIINK